MVPVHLLAFGVQAFVTTVTALVEVWSWTDRTDVEKQNITMLYGPYIALGMFITFIGGPPLTWWCRWSYGVGHGWQTPPSAGVQGQA